jgi:hypothetical protein
MRSSMMLRGGETDPYEQAETVEVGLDGVMSVDLMSAGHQECITQLSIPGAIAAARTRQVISSLRVGADRVACAGPSLGWLPRKHMPL